jgi:hypothetical protein
MTCACADLDYVLHRFEMEASVGCTPGNPALDPKLEGKAKVGRADEIAAFLDESLASGTKGTCPYVIIDDRQVVMRAHTDLDALDVEAKAPDACVDEQRRYDAQAPERRELSERFGPHFVRTAAPQGLTDAAVAAAVEILQR